MSGSKLADTLRCAYNGPSVHDFNADDFFEYWFGVFNMKPVRTVEQVAESLKANVSDSARKRRKYGENQDFRERVKKKNRERWRKLIALQNLSRGETHRGEPIPQP